MGTTTAAPPLDAAGSPTAHGSCDAPLFSTAPLGPRLGATLALVVTFGVWAQEFGILKEALWLYVPLTLAAIALHFDRILAQVFVRAVGWMHLGLCALAAFMTGDKVPAGIALGSAAALLLLGSQPLYTEGVRRQFAPIGYRRMFIFAAVLLMGSSYVLVAAGFEWTMSSWHQRRAGAFALSESLLLLASIIGVLRMRAWGVVAAGVGAIGAGAIALLAATPSTRGVLGDSSYDHEDVRWLFRLAAGAALLMVSPIVASWFVPVRPSVAKGRPRAAWLHTAAVVAALAAAACGVLNGGMLREF